MNNLDWKNNLEFAVKVIVLIMKLKKNYLIDKWIKKLTKFQNMWKAEQWAKKPVALPFEYFKFFAISIY